MKLLKAISSAVLITLVLFSSSYVMVGLHICGDRVQNVALFSKAEPCAMEKMMPPCHKHAANPCCEDETVVHDAQDYQATVKVVVPDASFVDLVQPTVVLSEVVPSHQVTTPRYFNYDSPLRASDLTVSLRVFLI